MNKNDYISLAKKVLIYKNMLGIEQQKIFEEYSYLKDECPIENLYLQNILVKNVILDKEIYNKLIELNKISNKERREIPFILYGKEKGRNIIIDECIVYPMLTNKLSNVHSTMLNNILSRSLNEQNLIAALGTTRPHKFINSDKFNIGEIGNYLDLYMNNYYFKTRKVGFLKCLLTYYNDLKLIYYDDYNLNFFTLDNIYLKETKYIMK